MANTLIVAGVHRHVVSESAVWDDSIRNSQQVEALRTAPHFNLNRRVSATAGCSRADTEFPRCGSWKERK